MEVKQLGLLKILLEKLLRVVAPMKTTLRVNEEINVPTEGCHEFRLIDTGENGSGSVVVYDSNNEVIYNSPGNYGAGGAVSFIVNEVVLANNDNYFKRCSHVSKSC